MRPSEFELQVFSKYDDATFAASGQTVTMATSHSLRIVDSSDGVTKIPARVDREWFQKLETLVFRTEDDQKGSVLLYAMVVGVQDTRGYVAAQTSICPLHFYEIRAAKNSPPPPTTCSGMNAETGFPCGCSTQRGRFIYSSNS
ncbi:hypothetical protein C8J31_11438 [Rhizobium sp. PP-CC-2G-626]|nr:hypothetical protein C8J31_11438 [Rhizobium sp. PP-CC-2G-626]